MTTEQRYTGELHIDQSDREYQVLSDGFSRPIPVNDIYSLPDGISDGDAVTFTVHERTAGRHEPFPVAVNLRAACE